MTAPSDQPADVPPALREPAPRRSLADRPRGLLPLLIIASLVVFFLLITALTTDPPEGVDDITGLRADGIEFGPDQCPLVSIAELSSAMPELGAPTETLSIGGPQFVCNFAAAEPGQRLQVIGGSTGNGGQPEWDEWLTTPPGPEVLAEYNINEVPMVVIASTSGGELVAFRGTDNLVWRVDATLPDQARAHQIELSVARALGLR